jgi:hypothetical protein
MATVPFPASWSPVPDFTGNSQFVVDSAGTFWLVSNEESGASIYQSLDQGRTFTQVIAVPASGSSASLGFDPAIAIDSANTLYILGQTGTERSVEVNCWTYATATGQMSGPTVLSSGGSIPADYDVVDDGVSSALAVICFLNSTAENIQWFHLTPGDVLATSGSVVENPTLQGSRYGSVSLVKATPPGGVASVLCYFTAHAKAVTFQDFIVSIQVCIWAADQVGPLSTVYSFPARHIDHRLTVTPSADGTAFYLSMGFYTQSQAQYAGNLVLGSYTPAANLSYNFVRILGTPTASFLEPTFSASSAGLVLAYLLSDLTLGMAVDAPIQLVDVNPAFWQLSARTDFPYQATARWLRGTQSPLPSAVAWAFASERASDDSGRLFSGFNSPPVAVLSPASITGFRDVAISFDASASYDINMNPLAFAWAMSDPTGLAVFTSSGTSATLLVPSAVGPAVLQIEVTVSVTALDADGSPPHAAVNATAVVTLGEVPAPVISLAGYPSPLSNPVTLTAAARNVEVTIAPLVSAPGETLTYLWQQISGTTVAVLSGPADPTLQFTTDGASIYSETLSFEVIVSDQVNTPVSQIFNVPVLARQVSPEIRVLNRITRAGTLQARNTMEDWSLPQPLGYITEFTKARRGSLLSGDSTRLLISAASILVESGATIYHVYTPDPADSILDAVLNGSDVLLVLVSSMAVLVINPTGNDTDNAFNRIAISLVSLGAYTTLTATPQVDNQRVLALSGSSGCLLLLVECTGYTVIASLEISTESGLLYGADSIQWVRLSSVESLHSGEVLVGTVDGQGDYFETLVSLTSRSILAVWDATAIRNNLVTTGEILTTNPDTYAGSPLAPILSSPAASLNNTVSLSWSQTRNDLVTAYEVQMATDGVTFGFLQRINSGQVQSTLTAALLPGVPYTFQIRALSLDGSSPWSNAAAIAL